MDIISVLFAAVPAVLNGRKPEQIIKTSSTLVHSRCALCHSLKDIKIIQSRQGENQQHDAKPTRCAAGITPTGSLALLYVSKFAYDVFPLLMICISQRNTIRKR